MKDINSCLKDYLILLYRLIWNKNLICRFYLTRNDVEIHRNRFSRYIAVVETIAKEMKQLNINYNEKRIIKIINILTKIQQYDN